MTENNRIAAAILGISLIISASVGAAIFYKAKGLENTLTVTGSARRQVTADAVRWVSGFSRSVSPENLKTGYGQMAQDTQIVKAFFKNRGIDESQVTVSPVSLEQPYRYDSGAGQAQNNYTLRQTVEVKSGDVQKVTDLANDVQQLINSGLVFSTQTLDYSYSKLSDLRVDLLNDAMKDAQKRGANIAQSGGKKLGDLRSASMGVVQVLSAGSNDVSDYGTYDTSGVNKDVMVTVRADFSLK